jgi:hypothetical protein
MIWWCEMPQKGESVGSDRVSGLRSVGVPLIGYILGLWSRSVMVTQYVIYSKLYITAKRQTLVLMEHRSSQACVTNRPTIADSMNRQTFHNGPITEFYR